VTNSSPELTFASFSVSSFSFADVTDFAHLELLIQLDIYRDFKYLL